MRPTGIRRSALPALAGAGVAAVLLLGACGDDSDDPDASTDVQDDTSPGSEAPAGSDGDGAGPSTAMGGDATMVSCVAAVGTSGDADSAAVEISGFTFRPGEIEIDAGTSVTFANADGADHSVWSADRVDGSPAWLSVGSDPAFRLPEVLHEGDASTCTFAAAGTYEYLCGVHNSMTGTVEVR